MTEIELARQCYEANDFDNAYKLCDKNLKEDPNHPKWLTIMGLTLLGAGKPTVAYSLTKRVTEIAPKDAYGWLNMGMVAAALWRDDEAERCYRRGLKFSTEDEQRSMLHVNMSSVLIDTGRFSEAEPHCIKALEMMPGSVKGHSNLGFCQLAQRNWKGWANYRYVLGHEWRPRHSYGDEPDWSGEKGTIAIYGEQGLGDQISFASMIPDMLKWAKENDSRFVFDIQPRLEQLFKRSFPEATVYGTQGQKVLSWAEEDTHIDYSLPIGQCAEFFRTTDESFPGTPYLKADPDRVLQWQSLFNSKKKPTIGIAWSGGIPKTGSKFRRVGLEQLKPILDSVDAHWVSLQYKPSGKEIQGTPIVEYRHGTLSNDYDDTVAMIASLDMVIAMHTTAIHVAGGLGIPCWTMVPKNSQWRYGQGVDDFLWAKSVRLFRQTERGEWADVIDRIAGELRAVYPRVSKEPAKATRKGKLRRDRTKIRSNGSKHNGQTRA